MKTILSVVLVAVLSGACMSARREAPVPSVAVNPKGLSERLQLVAPGSEAAKPVQLSASTPEAEEQAARPAEPSPETSGQRMAFRRPHVAAQGEESKVRQPNSAASADRDPRLSQYATRENARLRRAPEE